jgi:ubiquinone/menaquinone biosynthesis C-methylase UbiE
MSDYEPWQLDGEASELYERYLVPAITSIWAADLVERAGPAAEERVLDIACGTGAVTRLVADRISTGRVVGLDYNPEMLAVARSVCPKAPLSNGWRAAHIAFPFTRAHSILFFAS